VIVDYLDEHKARFGIEPVCAVLKDAGLQSTGDSYDCGYTGGAGGARTHDPGIMRRLKGHF
jgi:hypothetical protein